MSHVITHSTNPNDYFPSLKARIAAKEKHKRERFIDPSDNPNQPTPQATPKADPIPHERQQPQEEDAEPTTTKLIYQWLFTASATLSCFVRDVNRLRPHEEKGFDFFWLKRMPCRTVKLVGMVVGVQRYERRVIYTIDDGTEVIDCNHKPKVLNDIIATGKVLTMAALAGPTPIADVGQSVAVIGRVVQKYEHRVIEVESIDVCRSPNEELLHAKAVKRLHKECYSLNEPFVIPALKVPVPETPTKPRGNTTQRTPSTIRSSPASSLASSPIAGSSQPSPSTRTTEKIATPPSPIRLRHPSRLHTGDLTENTFRIYLKHYMDNASNRPISQTPKPDIDSDAENYDLPATPTKRGRHPAQLLDETPRAKQLCRTSSNGATPRPRARRAPSPDPSPPTHTPNHGFTLSYLRRVPELRYLATRVVRAVAKRVARAEKHKLKEMCMDTSRRPGGSSMSQKPKTSSVLPRDKLRSKCKRLFEWAIVQLLNDGSIIIWDGPLRTCPPANTSWSLEESHLWKISSSTSTAESSRSSMMTTTMGNGTSSSLFTLSSIDLAGEEDGDDGNLSDPPRNEEGYISLTPRFFSTYVLSTMEVLGKANERRGDPYRGCTAAEILKALRGDDVWRQVGEWSVDDALQFLQAEGKVWYSKGARTWDLAGV